MRLFKIPFLISLLTTSLSFTTSMKIVPAPSPIKTITTQPFHTWLISDATNNQPVLLVRLVTDSCKSWEINLKKNFAMDWKTNSCNAKINTVSWSDIYDNMITNKKLIKKELTKMQKVGQDNYNDFETKVDLKINNLSGKDVKFEHVDALGNVLPEDQYFGTVPELSGGEPPVVMKDEEPSQKSKPSPDDDDYDYNNTGAYNQKPQKLQPVQPVQPVQPQKDQKTNFAPQKTQLTKKRYPRTFYTYEKHLWLIKNANTNENIALFYSRKQNTCKTWLLKIKEDAELELEGDACQDLTSGKHVELIIGDKKVQRFLNNPKVKTFGQGDGLNFKVVNEMRDEVAVYWVNYDAEQIKF